MAWIEAAEFIEMFEVVDPEYPEYELMQASEVVVDEGPDRNWYVTELPTGGWAAWDDSTPGAETFDSREEAIQNQRDGFEVTDLNEEAWVA